MRCENCDEGFSPGIGIYMIVAGRAGVSKISGNQTLVDEQDAVFLHEECLYSYLIEEVGVLEGVMDEEREAMYDEVVAEVKAMVADGLRNHLGPSTAAAVINAMEEDGTL